MRSQVLFQVQQSQISKEKLLALHQEATKTLYTNTMCENFLN